MFATRKRSFLVSLVLVGVALFAACLWALGAARSAAQASYESLAREIIAATGVQGGLVVHLGCGDGRLSAALGACERYLVHGLARDPESVRRAREYIRARGLYGRVSVEQWDGEALPYVDNLVNLVVAEDLGRVPMAEVLRVLAPGGVAYVKQGAGWKKTTKPWPKEIDQWTHFLHDATNNAVANDTRVAPPKYMQWVAEPLYCRSHEIDSSVMAVVSARGRLFYILDEGLPGITDQRLPAKWAVVARDGFSGVLLWKRPLRHWSWREWKRDELEGKDWTKIRGQRTRFPSTLARRLVAVGDKVYVTLGYVAPLSVLDAATGKTLFVCEGTKGTDEIACAEGIVVVRIKNFAAEKQKRRTGKASGEEVVALDAETGQELWRTQTPQLVPLTLALADGGVFFCAGGNVVRLNANTGAEQWRTPVEKAIGSVRNLVVQDGAVVLLGAKGMQSVSASSGKTLWVKSVSAPRGSISVDLFVIDGMAWHGVPTPGFAPKIADTRPGKNYTGAHMVGYDVISGEEKKVVDVPNIISPGHHFRCYRSKATVRYILWPKRGVEFIDLEGNDHMRHDWLRAPCRYGVLPCNGLLYVPPHQCFCYPGVKIAGFNALAGAGQGREGQKPEPVAQRLVRGPAYGAVGPRPAPEEWPTYRHDALRSGAASCALSPDVDRRWEVSLGGKLTQPVIAAGKVFLASVDSHTLYALDASSGRMLWSYVAGGRIDSPPTYYRGLLLFGSADGWVYCLRASDGALCWRFRAAPLERRVVAFGQVESAWPVHGSVLVKDGVAYCAAGRSSYLDGGIYLYGLDPRSGRVLCQTVLEGPYPDLSKDVGRPFDMEGTFADVLVTDGQFLYMQQVMLDSKLNVREAPRITNMGDRKVGRHIFSTAGFLDDTWWNRTFWMYSERWPGYYIANQAPKAGQLLVFDDTTTYGVKVYTRRNVHSPMFFPATDGYLLFADDNDNEPALVDASGKPKPVKWLPYEYFLSSKGKAYITTPSVDWDKGVGFVRTRPPKWMVWAPLRARAMVVAGQTLFVAGPPDVLDPRDPLGAFEGRKGGMMWALSTKDGSKLGEYRLTSPPVFDGLVAARGRLYLCTRDGRLLCFG